MNPTRYSGLVKIAFHMEKTGTMWDRYKDAHPLLSTGSYFTPYLGAGMTGGDTINSAVKAIGAFGRGNFRSGFGHTLGTVGNAALTATGLIPVVGAPLAGLARGAVMALKGAKGLGAASRASRAASALGTAGLKAPMFAGAARKARAASLYSHLPGVDRLARYAPQMLQTSRHISRFGRPFYGWRAGLGGVALLGAGGLMQGSSSPGIMPVTPGSGRSGGLPAYGQGGFFEAQQVPGRFRGLPGMDPSLKPSELPFSGTPTPWWARG